MAGLRNRQRPQIRRWLVCSYLSCECRLLMRLTGSSSAADEKGQREHDQRDMYVIRNRPCSPLNPLQPEEVLKTVKGIPRLTAPFARLRSVVGGTVCCVRSIAASNL
jgi:hypothetical protein